MFAVLGWDPTWQRRVPKRVKIAWNVAISTVVGALVTLTAISAFTLPRNYRWIPVATLLAAVLVLAVVQTTLRREVLARLDIDADQRLAREIQSRLLPMALPTMPGVELAHHYAPFRLVGGDYYDAVRLDDSRLLIAMADVSGKGTGAALLTATLQAVLHFAVFGRGTLDEAGALSPDALAEAINAHLVEHTETNRFVTMVLAVLDIESRRLRYVNAGHNPPLGLTPERDQLRLEATGLPLGMPESSAFRSVEQDLPPGTTLVLYTDGLSEHPNRSGEMYGEGRILDVLRASVGQPAQRVAEALIQGVGRFADGQSAEDDVALLVVRTP
jgi:phosphoserine phosphatase RsbU/P